MENFTTTSFSVSWLKILFTQVLLGVENLLTAKDGRYQRLKVESAEAHENYAYADGQRGYYDIAVLTLNSDMEYEPLMWVILWHVLEKFLNWDVIIGKPVLHRHYYLR